MREDYPNYRRFECMTLEFDAFGPIQYELRESADCLRRQLSQAEARIKELEADRDSCRQRIELAEQYHDQAEAEIVELRRAINGVAPTDPKRFEDLDLCVALNNHADLATVAPVVRAAMEQEDHHSDAARHYPHDPRDLCACGVCVQVRSLPAAVLERMGVDR